MDLVEARKKAKELQAKQGTPPSPDPAAAAQILKPEPKKPEPKPGKKKKAGAKTKPQAPAKKIEAKESKKAAPAKKAAPKAPEKKPAKAAAQPVPAPAQKQEPVKPECGEDAFVDMNFGEDLPKVESADHELVLEEKKPAEPAPRREKPPAPVQPVMDMEPPPPAREKAKPAEDKLRPTPVLDVSIEKDFYELVVEDLVQYGYGELETKANLVELLGFRLGTETYAIPLVKIQQIIKPRPITLVPGAPHHILGIISLRGMIIPIFDLRRRLGLEPGPASRQSRIIIIKVGDNVLAGMFVDQVMEVARIPRDGIEDTHSIFSSSGPGMEAEFLEGIARHKNLMLIILNLDQVVLGKNEEGKAG